MNISIYVFSKVNINTVTDQSSPKVLYTFSDTDNVLLMIAPAPAVNCKWSSWTKHGLCSEACGTGIQRYTRNKIVRERNFGTCDDIYSKQEDCFLRQCPGRQAFLLKLVVTDTSFRNHKTFRSHT